MKKLILAVGLLALPYTAKAQQVCIDFDDKGSLAAFDCTWEAERSKSAGLNRKHDLYIRFTGWGNSNNLNPENYAQGHWGFSDIKESFGVGYRYNFDSNLIVGIEVVRRTWTAYVEDNFTGRHLSNGRKDFVTGVLGYRMGDFSPYIKAGPGSVGAGVDYRALPWLSLFAEHNQFDLTTGDFGVVNVTRNGKMVSVGLKLTVF